MQKNLIVVHLDERSYSGGRLPSLVIVHLSEQIVIKDKINVHYQAEHFIQLPEETA